LPSVTVVGCQFLQEGDVSFRELFDNEFIHEFGLGLVEAMVDVVGLLESHLVLQEDFGLEVALKLLEVKILVFVTFEALHFWMIGVVSGQDLEDLVDVEASLDGVQVSGNHVSVLTEFALDTLALAIEVDIVPVVAHDGVVVHSLLGDTSADLVCPNLSEFLDQIVNIQFLNHQSVDFFSCS